MPKSSHLLISYVRIFIQRYASEINHEKFKSYIKHFIFIFLLYFFSCRSNRSDPEKITMRPRVFIENSAPVPIIDEYDFTNVQIGTIDNIFTEDPDDRTYALWFSLDRRSAITLQKETIRRRVRHYS